MHSVYFNYLYNYEHRSGAYVPPHTHNIYEMVFYNLGKGKSNTDKGNFDFAPEQCILYSPLVNHDETHESYTNVDCVGFYLENNVLPTMHFDRSTAELFELKRRLCNELRDRKSNYSDMADLIVGEMVVYMLRRSNVAAEQQPVSCVGYVTNLSTKILQRRGYQEIGDDPGVLVRAFPSYVQGALRRVAQAIPDSQTIGIRQTPARRHRYSRTGRRPAKRVWQPQYVFFHLQKAYRPYALRI